MVDTIEARLQALLAPQERYDALHALWRTRAGAKACDLGYANSYDGPDERVLAAMRDVLASTKTLSLQYTPFGGSTVTRRCIATQLVQTHRQPFEWRDVVLTPGAMAALNIVLRALAAEGPGGEVIVITPCWLDYPVYLTNLALTPVFAPLRRDTFRFDYAALQKLITPATRAVLFSQPSNPAGVLFSDDDLAELANVVVAGTRGASYRPMIISDEAHRDILFDIPRRAFPSPALHYDRTCTVYSFGKSLLIQGQRTGYLAVSPRDPARAELARSLERLCRIMGFCTPTALMQAAVRSLVTYTPDLSAFDRRRRQITLALSSYGYEVVPSNATYFLYVRTPTDVSDFEFVETLARRGVFVLPAALFHDSGYFRISVTASQAMIDRALEIFREEAESLRRGAKERALERS